MIFVSNSNGVNSNILTTLKIAKPKSIVSNSNGVNSNRTND